ncbi:hypothetical protein [Aliikangiella coralliicola]|uniref:DUF2796 domain-containing protein n=1 Tax=Aliikangiella coralliicola TaxID=2592383 RepID=A0A545UC57_9GAMM|nr:hypothetical protein [Aliikangiella coralliicola]TQV87046.1 hypothetical protein FLL46_14670 [Aliikangiella coralliicola]
MIKRLFVLLIISQLLINGVWASAHMAESDHASHNIPHLHLDISYQSDALSSWGELDQNSPDSPSEHSVDKHFHIHLHIFLLSNEIAEFNRRFSSPPVFFESRLTSLTHTPPVPPPTL